MALTEERPRKIDQSVDEIRCEHPVAADTKVFWGSYVCVDVSEVGALPLAYEADRVFAGVAVRTVDNSGGAVGDQYVPVRSQFVEDMPLPAGFTAADVGVAVYLTDDDNAITKSSTNAIEAGKVLAVDTRKNVLRVAFKAASLT